MQFLDVFKVGKWPAAGETSLLGRGEGGRAGKYFDVLWDFPRRFPGREVEVSFSLIKNRAIIIFCMGGMKSI